MNDSPDKNWRPSPEPQTELERLIKRAAGEEVGNDLRLIVWLRHAAPIFYNDFSLMIGKLVPPHLKMLCAAVTSEDQRTIAFLQNQTPLWPLTKAG